MPETSLLLWGVLFSSIGIGYVVYGRCQKNKIVFYCGIALLVYPYFVPELITMITLGCGLILMPRFIKL